MLLFLNGLFFFWRFGCRCGGDLEVDVDILSTRKMSVFALEPFSGSET